MKSGKLFIPCIYQKKLLKRDTITVIKVDTKFVNSENGKTSSSHVLILKITLSNLSIYYTWQNIKQFYPANFIFLKTFNSKFRAIEV